MRAPSETGGPGASEWVIARCVVQLFLALDNCLLSRGVLGEQNSVTCRLFPPQLTSPVGVGVGPANHDSAAKSAQYEIGRVEQPSRARGK